MAEEAALDALRDIFRYHAWATLRLIDFCAGLPPEQLGGSVPGTRGPILDTLRHIVRADYGYKMRFKVHSKPELEDEDVPSLERMRTIFARESEIWLTLLGRLRELDLDPDLGHRGCAQRAERHVFRQQFFSDEPAQRPDLGRERRRGGHPARHHLFDQVRQLRRTLSEEGIRSRRLYLVPVQ